MRQSVRVAGGGEGAGVSLNSLLIGNCETDLLAAPWAETILCAF